MKKCFKCGKQYKDREENCFHCKIPLVIISDNLQERDKEEDISKGMKKCPYCAEEIKNEAIKCKHCGEFLREKEQTILKKSIIMTCPKCGGNYDNSWKVCSKCDAPLVSKEFEFENKETDDECEWIDLHGKSNKFESNQKGKQCHLSKAFRFLLVAIALILLGFFLLGMGLSAGFLSKLF
ncbi:MAG: zinc ribbon domain-containing protein [Candidatus Omnitrophota bacterium]